MYFSSTYIKTCPSGSFNSPYSQTKGGGPHNPLSPLPPLKGTNIATQKEIRTFVLDTSFIYTRTYSVKSVEHPAEDVRFVLNCVPGLGYVLYYIFIHVCVHALFDFVRTRHASSPQEKQHNFSQSAEESEQTSPPTQKFVSMPKSDLEKVLCSALVSSFSLSPSCCFDEAECR